MAASVPNCDAGLSEKDLDNPAGRSECPDCVGYKDEGPYCIDDNVVWLEIHGLAFDDSF